MGWTPKTHRDASRIVRSILWTERQPVETGRDWPGRRNPQAPQMQIGRCTAAIANGAEGTVAIQAWSGSAETDESPARQVTVRNKSGVNFSTNDIVYCWPARVVNRGGRVFYALGVLSGAPPAADGLCRGFGVSQKSPGSEWSKVLTGVGTYDTIPITVQTKVGVVGSTTNGYRHTVNEAYRYFVYAAGRYEVPLYSGSAVEQVNFALGGGNVQHKYFANMNVLNISSWEFHSVIAVSTSSDAITLSCEGATNSTIRVGEFNVMALKV